MLTLTCRSSVSSYLIRMRHLSLAVVRTLCLRLVRRRLTADTIINTLINLNCCCTSNDFLRTGRGTPLPCASYYYTVMQHVATRHGRRYTGAVACSPRALKWACCGDGRNGREREITAGSHGFHSTALFSAVSDMSFSIWLSPPTRRHRASLVTYRYYPVSSK